MQVYEVRINLVSGYTLNILVTETSAQGAITTASKILATVGHPVAWYGDITAKPVTVTEL